MTAGPGQHGRPAGAPDFAAPGTPAPAPSPDAVGGPGSAVPFPPPAPGAVPVGAATAPTASTRGSDAPGANLAPAASAKTGPAARKRGLMGAGTLSRELILRVTALVALVSIALSALTVLAVHTLLQQQLDRKVAEIASLSDRGGRGDAGTGGPNQTQGLIRCDDNVIDTSTGATGWGCWKASGLTRQWLDVDKTKALVTSATDDPKNVVVPGEGTYRAQTTRGGGVVALSTHEVDDPTMGALAAAGVLTLASILLSFLAARRVVERSLRPLQRLATTAHQVSQLELDSGEVSLPFRVPAKDTDGRSEVGQVGLAFNHMLDNVEGALDARQKSETRVRQFVADASHELRNPLASIRGYSELTRRERDQVPPNTAHALNRIESESARMSALVEDLLLLARLDTDPNLRLTATSLNEIVANAVSDAQVAGPDHDWELTLPERDVVAVGDPFRLLQVVANLLANARTHTPAGTLVRTSLSSEGGYAVIRVADNGPGIPPGIRDKVFERFTRADASRVRSGKGQSTGLGLAIVSAVMQAHRGSASVESSDAGTTFTIRVPLAVEERSGTPRPGTPVATP